MNTGLKYFVLLNAAVALFYVLWRLSAWWAGAASRRSGARRWGALGKVFLLAAVTAPLLCAGLERLPATRGWLPGTPLAGRILVGIEGPLGREPAVDGELVSPVPQSHPTHRITPEQALPGVWLLGVLALSLHRARQWLLLRRLLAGAVAVRRRGAIEILVHPGILSPFATRIRGAASVVVPSFLVEKGRFREAVRHELQHHRQGDPPWTLVWDALTVVLWVNPAVWCWRRRSLELQELACDERLLEGGAVNPARYAETLLDVAEALARFPAARPGACSPSLAGHGGASLLARRLERILNPSPSRRSTMYSWIVWFLVGSGLWLALAGGWAADSTTVPATRGITAEIDLQKVAEEALQAHLQRLEAASGVALIMDPSSGKVLARAGYLRDKATGRMTPEESAPITRGFPAASTMKTLVVAAALEAGAVDGSETFDTGGGPLTVAGQAYGEWREGGLGMVTPAEVLVKSSNLGSIQIARRLGKERLAGFLGRLGIKQDEGASEADLALGICPGSPITAYQLAYAYSALANGGRDPQSGLPLVRPEVARYIRQALVKAVEEGTGTQAHCQTTACAGKTGTAIREQGGRRIGTALFVGFAPADRPAIVISVIVDDPAAPASGNRHAATLFRDLAETSLPLLPLRPPLAQ